MLVQTTLLPHVTKPTTGTVMHHACAVVLSMLVMSEDFRETRGFAWYRYRITVDSGPDSREVEANCLGNIQCYSSIKKIVTFNIRKGDSSLKIYRSRKDLPELSGRATGWRTH